MICVACSKEHSWGCVHSAFLLAFAFRSAAGNAASGKAFCNDLSVSTLCASCTSALLPDLGDGEDDGSGGGGAGGADGGGGFLL